MNWNLVLMTLIDLSLLDWITVGLSLYVAYGSLDAITRMCEGMRQFCHKCKYVLSLGASLAFIYFTLTWQLTPELKYLVFGMAGTLALFIWPRTVWRLRRSIAWPELPL